MPAIGQSIALTYVSAVIVDLFQLILVAHDLVPFIIIGIAQRNILRSHGSLGAWWLLPGFRRFNAGQ